MTEFYAVILAAGLSSRMGALKPLLQIAGESVIQRVTRIFIESGAVPIVVTGHRTDEVKANLSVKYPEVRTVCNPDYETGMFSSVVAGVRAVPPEARAFFLTPADCCAVLAETIRAMTEAYSGSVLYPEYQGKRGHPVLIPIERKQGLAAHNGTNGARGYLSRLTSNSIEVNDPGILLDMDTPEDYESILNTLKLR